MGRVIPRARCRCCRRKPTLRVEMTLTGVCHCPRQIISNTARCIPTLLPRRRFLGVRRAWKRGFRTGERAFVSASRTLVCAPVHAYNRLRTPSTSLVVRRMVFRCTFSSSTHFLAHRLPRSASSLSLPLFYQFYGWMDDRAKGGRNCGLSDGTNVSLIKFRIAGMFSTTDTLSRVKIDGSSQ